MEAKARSGRTLTIPLSVQGHKESPERRTTPPDLDYYRRARHDFAVLFAKYQLQPPGASGLNVCMSPDLSTHPQAADAACCVG